MSGRRERGPAGEPRVAWLSAETPDRHGGGGHRRQYHQIRALRDAGVDVRVATLAGPQDDTTLRELVPVRRFGPLRRHGLLVDPVLGGFLDEGGFTAAVVVHIESVPHVRRALSLSAIPWLLDLQNVNSRWHRSRRETFAALQWRLREAIALRHASMATVCSREEADALLRATPRSCIEVAALGVDPMEWPTEALATQRAPVIGFFAAWGHSPNREGAEWMAQGVWPRVRRMVPEARLLLAGPGNPPGMLLARPGVQHVGRVDDLASFLGNVRVAVVPIIHGIGARMKFGEALASGAAVVSTSTGAEGFEAEGAFARADDAEAFAWACIELLRDAERAAALGSAGRALALERFRWEETTEPIFRFVRHAAP